MRVLIGGVCLGVVVVRLVVVVVDVVRLIVVVVDVVVVGGGCGFAVIGDGTGIPEFDAVSPGGVYIVVQRINEKKRRKDK
jgi:hypothetical protein